MLSGRYEDGKRIVSVDIAEEVGRALNQVNKFQIEIAAAGEVIKAFGTFDNHEELGIEPDEEGLTSETYKRGRWN